MPSRQSEWLVVVLRRLWLLLLVCYQMGLRRLLPAGGTPRDSLVDWLGEREQSRRSSAVAPASRRWKTW